MARRPSSVTLGYLASVVGAGFASGQEVASFFTLQPAPGAALLAATLTLALGGGLLVRRAAAEEASSLEELLARRSRRLASWFAPLWLAYLWVILAAMLAGCAALLEQRGLPGRLGSALLGLLVAWTAARGVELVDRLYRWLVPAKIGALAGLAALGWLGPPVGGEADPGGGAGGAALGPGLPPPGLPPPGPALGAIFLGAAFGGYNLLLSAGVLLPETQAPGRREAPAAALGGLLAGAMAALVDAALRRAGPEVLAYPVPMERLADLHGAWASALYAGVLMAAIFTTSVAVTLPLRSLGRGARRPSLAMAGVASVAWLVAQVGFVPLVRLAYPVMGGVALILLGWLGRVRGRARR
ncbi:MAG: hypothetical protein QJR14_08655 [Bacillota bacterium]|nr:hypothetical protein [Bacillota bacterium]